MKSNGESTIKQAREHLIRDWPCPKGCSIRTFAMREIDGDDEVEAAMAAEIKATDGERESKDAMSTIISRERMRLSLVEVDGRQVNVDSLPFFELDEWNAKTIRCVERAYVRMNMLSEEDVASFDLGGKIRGAAEDDVVEALPPAPLREGETLIKRPSRG